MAKRRRPDVNSATFSSFSAPREATVVSYAGDKPNPNLRRFAEENATPFDPETDAYDVPAFDQPITTTKVTAIYNMHSYHQGKKPHDAIRQYIRHFTQPGSLVMDPFSGSGGTSLAALLEGRRAIAIDRSPAATFITKNYCSPVDPASLRRAFETLKNKVSHEIEWLYETRCDKCDGKAKINFTVYSQVFQCSRCLNKISLFECDQTEGQTAAGKPKKIRVCPHCHKQGYKETIRSQGEKFGSVPVMVAYECLAGCSQGRQERLRNDPIATKAEYFSKYDLAKIQEIDRREIPYEVPRGYSLKGFSRYQRDALYYYGVEEVSDLFTKRNLWALSVIRNATRGLPLEDTLLFALEAVLINLSRMQGNTTDERFPNNIIRGTLYIPQISREYSVLPWLSGKINNLVAGYKKLSEYYAGYEPCCVSTQSSEDLSGIPSSSVDYVFTDPPYSDNVQYGELNHVWEAWLGFERDWHAEEIIVNDTRNISEADWAERMRRVMSECYRVLKPGRWLSLCYHDTSEGTWALVQDIMAEVGFVVDKNDRTLFIDTGQKSFNQLNADKATKRDLVLNFRKPKLAPTHYVARIVDGRTFSEVARQVVRDFLTSHPGATKDRIYDELVSRLIQSGKMESHDFDALLRSVAEEVREPVKKNLFEEVDPNLFGTHVHSRWYLKETADELDQAEQEKEDAAAARLEALIVKHLKKQPEDEGVHYTNLQEEFFNIPVGQWPRRKLFDWLPEYFYKTSVGTWRPPADDKERDQKAALRQTGTLRRIKRFANALIEGVPVRDKDRPSSDRTLADWIRQCRRAGLFEQGRALYEKGGLSLDRLNEVEQIEVEDDYRICARRGAAAEAKPRRKRRDTDDE